MTISGAGTGEGLGAGRARFAARRESLLQQAEQSAHECATKRFLILEYGYDASFAKTEYEQTCTRSVGDLAPGVVPGFFIFSPSGGPARA